MILKEIEMDLPYERNESRIKNSQITETMDYDTAVKMDYNLYWKDKRRAFQLSTRCMTSMVERLISPIITADCWKILIECVNIPEENVVKNFLGVYVVQVQFDYEKYIISTDFEKKKIIISEIVKATNIVSQETGMDLEEVRHACYQIQKIGFVNEWLWGNSKKNKDNYVQIKVRHEVEEVLIFMIFMDKKKNIIKEIKLVSTVPDEREYSRYLGKLKWVSDNEAVLIAKNGDEFKYLI